MSAIPDDWLAVDAATVAPMFGCKPEHVRDDISKEPGFPAPVNRRPLMWPLGLVREYQIIRASRQARRR